MFNDFLQIAEALSYRWICRRHISYGAGVRRCVGDRLTDLQLHVLWEEILKRDLEFEVLDAPTRLFSNFVHVIRKLPVRIPGKVPDLALRQQVADFLQENFGFRRRRRLGRGGFFLALHFVDAFYHQEKHPSDDQETDDRIYE